MNKQPEIREKTRSELITAFWKLYEKKSIDKITISQLTSVAGYHRGTFYEYFKDIYDLLEQEEAALITDWECTIAKLYVSDEFENFIPLISQFYIKNGYHLNILITQGNLDFMNRFKETIYPIFLKIQGMDDTTENRLIIEYGVSGILMTIHQWYEGGCQPPPEDFLKLMYTLIFKGFFGTVIEAKNGTLKDLDLTMPDGFEEMISKMRENDKRPF